MAASCEFCSNYVYDDDEEEYYCDVNLDEDEMGRFLRGTVSARMSILSVK